MKSNRKIEYEKPKMQYEKSAKDAGALNVDTPMDNSMPAPMAPYGRVSNMESITTENLDKPGFEADGECIYKHGTPYGEKAKLNVMPPGMDISDQPMAIINNMPLRELTDISYPGDGGFSPRDVPE